MIQGPGCHALLQPATMVKGTSKRSLNESDVSLLTQPQFVSFCPHANIILKFACDHLSISYIVICH